MVPNGLEHSAAKSARQERAYPPWLVADGRVARAASLAGRQARVNELGVARVLH